ncbi:hypothetical protein SKAU_G00254070 [Synaphobranchus kaupii]|uniref:Uncharacterized protein n=1 Tax=Synaphobranchus kaupii TaxID=118154 RepID=A0A9Q1F3E0_SYNKA|nr:hypothetical protein SKAU_G00254070 [Synaphobranchus kaupii]
MPHDSVPLGHLLWSVLSQNVLSLPAEKIQEKLPALTATPCHLHFEESQTRKGEPKREEWTHSREYAPQQNSL